MRLLGAAAGMILALGSQADPAANERAAAASLKPLSTAEADFRANDRDGNQAADYWVADVSGLYRIDPGVPLRLIERSIATADARPSVPVDKEGTVHGSKLIGLEKPMPKDGYWFAAIEKYENEKGGATPYDEGKGRNPKRFGICAYPAEHGKTGIFTFLINESYTVWKKDTGGKSVDLLPADLKKSGWIKQD
jgi:hypothetical protein